MIPELIQRRGAVHLDDEDAAAILLEPPSVVPLPTPRRAVLELVPESVARENLVLPVRIHGAHPAVALEPGCRACRVSLRDEVEGWLVRRAFTGRLEEGVRAYC